MYISCMALQKLILVFTKANKSRTRHCEYEVQIPRGKINFPTVHKCLDLNDNFGLPMPHHKLVVNHLCLVRKCSTPVGFLTYFSHSTASLFYSTSSFLYEFVQVYRLLSFRG